MPNSPFTVQFFKYPDRLHWRHDMVRLGEDEYGVWVGLRSGGTVQRGHEPAKQHPHDLLSVITHGAWFIPIFSPADPRFSLYVDICTPPVWATVRISSSDRKPRSRAIRTNAGCTYTSSRPSITRLT